MGDVVMGAKDISLDDCLVATSTEKSVITYSDVKRIIDEWREIEANRPKEPAMAVFHPNAPFDDELSMIQAKEKGLLPDYVHLSRQIPLSQNGYVSYESPMLDAVYKYRSLIP